MMNAVDVYALPPEQAKLRAYMLNYFSMMMAISSIFLTLDGSKGGTGQSAASCGMTSRHDVHLYRRCRFSVAEGSNLPGWLGSTTHNSPFVGGCKMRPSSDLASARPPSPQGERLYIYYDSPCRIIAKKCPGTGLAEPCRAWS